MRTVSLRRLSAVGIALLAMSGGAQVAGGQAAARGGAPPVPPTPQAPSRGAPPPVSAAARANPAVVEAVVPADYVIGTDDQLSIVFFLNKDASTDVTVRPDGKISLPLLNDIQASGLTPEELRGQVSRLARTFFQDPNPTIIVKQINSRRVFITGNVAKPGNYPLLGATSVLQLIATAGGITEEADAKKIVVMRDESGHHATYSFNYKEVVAQKNMKQNIPLRPGDIVVVP